MVGFAAPREKKKPRVVPPGWSQGPETKTERRPITLEHRALDETLHTQHTASLCHRYHSTGAYFIAARVDLPECFMRAVHIKNQAVKPRCGVEVVPSDREEKKLPPTDRPTKYFPPTVVRRGAARWKLQPQQLWHF